MERIDGYAIDDHEKLTQAGYDLAEIGAELADNLHRARSWRTDSSTRIPIREICGCG